jgi:SAM-dependent methyltransferase
LSTSLLRGAARCLECEGALAWDRELACVRCGETYPTDGGVPILLPKHGVDTEQAAYFDEADHEFELSRPHGTPVWYQWTLAEKFRRISDSCDFRDRTALVVCGGSGMDAEFLVRAGASVVTSDISRRAALRAIARAQRFGFELESIVASVTNLPFADESFDIVYVHDGLHHIERPLLGLREMARVARRAICVNEPAAAAVTRAAVTIGAAREIEEAGNAVARLDVAATCAFLHQHGFFVARRERYGMYYKHSPGLPSRLLSVPILFALGRILMRAGNTLVGGLGNKLAIVAVRAP